MNKIILLCICFCIFMGQCLAGSAIGNQQFLTKVKEIKQKEGNTEEGKEEKKKEPIKINESEFHPVLLGALLDSPTDYISKKIKFRGKFSSFTTLALDYDGALRKSKEYISLCIFRPDSKIPLSELKLAYPLSEAKENQTIRDLEEGDLLEFFGQVFSSALDEPWVDILSLKVIEKAPKKEDKLVHEELEADEDKNLKEKNKKQSN